MKVEFGIHTKIHGITLIINFAETVNFEQKNAADEKFENSQNSA